MTQAAYFETRRFSPGSLAMAAAIEFGLIAGAIAWQTDGNLRDRPGPTKIFHIEEARDNVVPPKEPDQVEPKPSVIDYQKPVVEVPPVSPKEPVTWDLPEKPIIHIRPLPPTTSDPPTLEPAKAKGDVRALLTADDYPEVARRRAETGTVRARLDIGIGGQVTGCTIVASSGSTALDSTTCRLLKTRARFTPAKDGNGQKVSDTYLTPKIVWTIERAS